MTLLLIGTALYFLPTILAFHRYHSSRGAIFVINLFFGWTCIGWILTLIWALSEPRILMAHPYCYPYYRR